MNNHPLFEDLLDQWVKKEITRDDLYQTTLGKDSDMVSDMAERHLFAVETIQQYGMRNEIALAHKRFRSYNTEVQTPAKVVSFNGRKWLVTVTSAAAIFAGVYFSQAKLFVSDQKLFEQTFQEYYINTERSAQNLQASNLTESFKNEDYAGVVSQYNSLENKTNRGRFLAGYAQLKLGNNNEAISLFQQILNENQKGTDKLYKDEAEYYLGLTYLKTGDTDKAYSYFNYIHNSKEHTFNEAVSNWTLFRLKWIN